MIYYTFPWTDILFKTEEDAIDYDMHVNPELHSTKEASQERIEKVLSQIEVNF